MNFCPKTLSDTVFFQKKAINTCHTVRNDVTYR